MDIGQDLKNAVSGDSVGKYIRTIHFPASKQDIVSAVKNMHAPDQVVNVVENMPDAVYQDVSDVIQRGLKL